MDDFYKEMRTTLEDIETSNFKPETIRRDSNILQEYFLNMFAEAWVPINARRWPAFTDGSTAASGTPEIGYKIKTPLDNLLVAKEYLETSQSDVQWRARLWQVAEDTTSINMSSELGGDVGSFAAGAASNKIAEGYMNEMIDTAVSMNEQEKLNLEMFKQTAREQNMDASKVRVTGLAREFVPEYMQGDICERPERNSRLDSWDNDDSTDDRIILGPGPNINPKSPSNDNGALNLPGKSSYDSSSYSDETISNTDNNGGNIFAKLFGFMGFGGDSGVCDASTYDRPFSSSSLSPEEAERVRDSVNLIKLILIIFNGCNYTIENFRNSLSFYDSTLNF